MCLRVQECHIALLTFLSQGDYRTLLVRDDPSESAAVKVEEKTVAKGESLEVSLCPAGGFIAQRRLTAPHQPAF